MSYTADPATQNAAKIAELQGYMEKERQNLKQVDNEIRTLESKKTEIETMNSSVQEALSDLNSAQKTIQSAKDEFDKAYKAAEGKRKAEVQNYFDKDISATQNAINDLDKLQAEGKNCIGEIQKEISKKKANRDESNRRIRDYANKINQLRRFSAY